MKTTLKSSLLAASISAVSLSASAGIDFTLVAETGYNSFLKLGTTPEVANDGTVLYNKYESAGKYYTWNDADGESLLPGYNQEIFGRGHMSNNGDYFVFATRDRWYNYHTPEGVVQRGMTGFSGRIIRQTSGEGDKLLAFSGTSSVTFYEENGRNEINNPRYNDYYVYFDLDPESTSIIQMPYSDSISNDGNRFVIWQGQKGYFVDVPEGGASREGQVTEIPHAISGITAMSDDGTTVIGTMSGYTAGCNISTYLYNETDGLTDLGCTDEYVATGLSGDGSKVIGINRLNNEAVIWDEVNGHREVRTLLLNAGYDTSAWTGLKLSDISEDGTKIVGWGIDGNEAGQVFLIESVPECSVGF